MRKKTEITDFCFYQSWSSWKCELHEATQSRVENKKQEGKEKGLTLKRKSSSSSQQIFEEVLLNEKITDWSETQSRNQQLGENEQTRKKYVWLFWIWLLGEKRSLNLSRVRSLSVTLALQSSTIVLPEVFPFGQWTVFTIFSFNFKIQWFGSSCFHTLLYIYSSCDLFSLPHPQPFPLWAPQNSLYQTIFSPNSFLLHLLTSLSY